MGNLNWKRILVLFLLSTHSLASNILRLPSFNQAQFVLKAVDTKHATAPYKTLNVDSTFDCLDTCTFDTSCRSVNVNENSQPLECQLVAADRNTADSYVTAAGFKHFDTGKKALTTFRHASYTGCIVPRSLSCDASATTTELMFTSQTERCEQLYAYYSFDLETGRLIHHCTGQSVCPASLGGSAKLQISNSCQASDKEGNYLYAFIRDYSKTILYIFICVCVESYSAEKAVESRKKHEFPVYLIGKKKSAKRI